MLNIKLYDSTSHFDKTEMKRDVLTTPTFTGTKCMIEQPNLAIETRHMITTNNQKQLNNIYVHYRQPNICIRVIELNNSYSSISNFTLEYCILHD